MESTNGFQTRYRIPEYLMQYDTVLKYVNEDAVSFNEFQLPQLLVPLSDPTATATAGAKIYKMTDTRILRT